MKCPKCGKKNSSEDGFCEECGHRLKKEVKKITVRFILAWIFGVLFILGGAVSFSDSLFGGLLIIMGGLVILPPVGNMVKDKFHIELSGWLKLIAFLILIGIGMSLTQSVEKKSVEKVSIPTEEKSVEEQVIITKPLNEMLPVRAEFPTEFMMGEIKGIAKGGKIRGDNDGNLPSGESLHISKLEGYSAIIIDTYIYRFSSVENARIYYEDTVNKIKQEGGYSDMSISAKATCFGYTKDYGFRTLATGICYKNNILFWIKGTSDTFEKSDSYVKNIIKIIDKKLN